jgi:hypothetical protein
MCSLVFSTKASGPPATQWQKPTALSHNRNGGRVGLGVVSGRLCVTRLDYRWRSSLQRDPLLNLTDQGYCGRTW